MNETNKGTTMGEQFNQHLEKRACLLPSCRTICFVDSQCLLNHTFPVLSLLPSAPVRGGGGASFYTKKNEKPSDPGFEVNISEVKDGSRYTNIVSPVTGGCLLQTADSLRGGFFVRLAGRVIDRGSRQ